MTETPTTSNGSGKSSIIDGILFALFGQTRSKTISLNDEGDCRASCEFSVVKHSYRVERYHKHKELKLYFIGGNNVSEQIYDLNVSDNSNNAKKFYYARELF